MGTGRTGRRGKGKRTRLELARVDLGPVDAVENLLELLVLVPQLLALASEAARLEVIVDADLLSLGVDGDLADDCAQTDECQLVTVEGRARREESRQDDVTHWC